MTKDPKITWAVTVEQTTDGFWDRLAMGGGWQWEIKRTIDYQTSILDPNYRSDEWDSRSGYARSKEAAERKVAHARRVIEGIVHTHEIEGEPIRIRQFFCPHTKTYRSWIPRPGWKCTCTQCGKVYR